MSNFPFFLHKFLTATTRNSHTMNTKLYLLCILCTFFLTIACNRSVSYECQCYNSGGIATNRYEIGHIDGKQVTDRCLAVQQQNMEFNCQGSGTLK